LSDVLLDLYFQMFLQLYSFICQVALTRRQRRDLFGLRVTCYYQSNHSKVEAISVSALPKDTTNELADVSIHYPFLKLNVKQGSCKYQL